MQHEMENRIASLERTGPVAFDCGGTMERLCFVIRGSLGIGRCREGREEKQKRDRYCRAAADDLQAKPPLGVDAVIDDFTRKNVGANDFERKKKAARRCRLRVPGKRAG